MKVLKNINFRQRCTRICKIYIRIQLEHNKPALPYPAQSIAITKNIKHETITKSKLNKLTPKQLISLNLLQITCNLSSHRLNLISKELVRSLAGQTVTETCDMNARIRIALPAVRSIWLDNDSGDTAVSAQSITLVLERLLLKQALA